MDLFLVLSRGRKTAEFLDAVMSRITLPGSFFLAVVAIMPAFAMMAGVNQSFAQFFGGTSLLIMVGVILDTLQQIESHLLMRHYDGLTKSGRIKGRAGSACCHIVRRERSLMILIKTADEIELMRKSNQLVSKTLAELAKIYPARGVTTEKLDQIAEGLSSVIMGLSPVSLDTRVIPKHSAPP